MSVHQRPRMLRLLNITNRGVALYAPPGMVHKTLNTGKDPLRIACVFIPAISTEYITANISAAKKAADSAK